jgi:hypothetical protein
MKNIKYLLISIFLVFMIFLSGCNRSWQGISHEFVKQTSEGIRYELFYVEGMPCMRFGGQISEQGTSCDWSQWMEINNSHESLVSWCIINMIIIV